MEFCLKGKEIIESIYIDCKIGFNRIDCYLVKIFYDNIRCNISMYKVRGGADRRN